MNADIEALLALQADDAVVDGIVARLNEIGPLLVALDTERERGVKRLEQAQAALAAEESRRRGLEQRVSEHRQKQERNVAQFDQVKRLREAEAAAQQVESGRRMLEEGEAELRGSSDRVEEMRRDIAAQEAALEALAGQQAAARLAFTKERASLEAELATAQRARAAVADRVPPPLRAKYDRIRSNRHSAVIFALEGGACGACETALPLQKRSMMLSQRTIDVCEACGVLLYASE